MRPAASLDDRALHFCVQCGCHVGARRHHSDVDRIASRGGGGWKAEPVTQQCLPAWTPFGPWRAKRRSRVPLPQAGGLIALPPGAGTPTRTASTTAALRMLLAFGASPRSDDAVAHRKLAGTLLKRRNRGDEGALPDVVGEPAIIARPLYHASQFGPTSWFLAATPIPAGKELRARGVRTHPERLLI